MILIELRAGISNLFRISVTKAKASWALGRPLLRDLHFIVMPPYVVLSSS